MGKDWVGNKNSVFKTLGASSHTDKERQNEDYYATSPIAATLLHETNELDLFVPIWECANGQSHLSDEFERLGYKVYRSDLVKRDEKTKELDFLQCNKPVNCNIVTNPPYKFATEFIEKALELIPDGKKVCMFLKIQFLEGKSRKLLYQKYPPKTIYVSSSRILCAKNADFEGMRKAGGSAVSYAWYCWTKGYQGDTILKWIN